MPSLKRTERSRNLILDAADRAFREFGFENTSVEDIAGRAGLTRKTVYNLFGSKEDIAFSLIARVEANDAGYRELMTRNMNVTELLEQVLTDSADWCMTNPSLARLALAPSLRPSLEPPSERPSFQGLVRDILALGQQQGLVRKDEGANYMALVLLGIYGQAMLNSLAGDAFDHSQVRRLIRIVVEGIGEQS
ncbi:TetR/AcrR family transcriptional regulator [Mesorhizobium sp. 1M-11]|uniref:TetR/AcrR family transcriptional regulator n=1 Tax=Mesorhizobium sp. 1M-11 TaxID=1529006 RepID=UPI0006C75043|nr:TetR/AcrR family transcriptional regulator [Mesorhizobium sp. 1M-11]